MGRHFSLVGDRSRASLVEPTDNGFELVPGPMFVDPQNE